MNSGKFSIKKRLKSFVYAFNGLKILMSEEHNARIHVFISILVIVAGVYFKVSLVEWIFLIFAMGSVIILEIVNSVIENIANFISPERHPKIKKIKDLSAGAVLLSAITAAIIGLIIFIPKLIAIWE